MRSAGRSRTGPFLKWAGGKKRLISQLAPLFPDGFRNYFEPFLGGGAIINNLFCEGVFREDTKAFLIDSNEELINTYRVIRDDVDGLIRLLSAEKFKNEEEAFYSIRGENPVDAIDRAARTIYLNKTCYNGLYRVNSKGQFNVPFGSYKRPRVLNEAKLKAVSHALSGADLAVGDFAICLEHANDGDFVYLDPPYQPLTRTSSFTSYTDSVFDEDEQRRLSEVFRELDRRGVKVMLSNSETRFVKSLYEGFRMVSVSASRVINCRPDKRGRIGELVVMNY